MKRKLVPPCCLSWSLATVLTFCHVPALAGQTEGLPLKTFPHPEPRVVVLMYHHLAETPKTRSTMTPALFREHLETLRRLGLPVISLPQLADFLAGRGQLPPESVVLTFDDGYESFYHKAFPELKRFRMPATVFAIVRPTQHPETAVPGLPHLTWAELKEMVGSGLVTVAPHTYDQHRFVTVAEERRTAPAPVSRAYLPEPGRDETVEEYEQRMLSDFAEANRLFQEHLGFTPEYMAFPYGRFDPWLVRLCYVSGYRFLFTTSPGVVTRATDPLRIPRYNAGSPDMTAAALEELLRKAFGQEATIREAE
ncbi:MAG TPA: polysaccharide deacetylase family protein [Firmicutes bacterium]|nr:polysaccharide deacetylase family protein [Bacillota bacterium]